FGLPEGRYLVSVGQDQRPGSARITTGRIFYPRAYYTGVTGESEAKAVEVSEGSEVTNIDIALPEAKRSCEISGRVVDAEPGQPVAGVGIAIGSVTPDGKPDGLVSIGVQSLANGEFRLLRVVPGKYSLLVRSDSDRGFISEPVILNVEEDVDGVEIKVRQGASISGGVVVEGTNDPKILSKLSQVNLYASIVARTPTIGHSSKVKPDGSFRIGGLQAGKVFISLDDMQDLVLWRIEHNGEAPPNGIEIQAGQQVTGVRVVLGYSSLKLRGDLKVIGPEAAAGIRFRVTARRPDLQMQYLLNAMVDARGQFVFENMSPGE